MAADVDDHAQLEEERPRRVKRAERREKSHGGATVRQLVQHGPEFGPLIEGAGRVAVKGVELQVEIGILVSRKFLQGAKFKIRLPILTGCNTRRPLRGSTA